MGIVDRILGRSEQRAQGGWYSLGVNSNGGSAAGVNINQDTATSIAALYSCVTLYANTVASMSWGAYIKDGGVRRPVARPRWMDKPVPSNRNYSGFEFKHRITTSLMLDGNVFILVLRSGIDVVETRVIDPRKVQILMADDGSPLYKITSTEGSVTVTDEEMIHIPLFAYGENLRGLSPVEHHRVTLGLASATQLYAAKFYEQGAAPSAIIRTPGELTEQQATSLRESFGRRHEGIERMHKIAVLSGGASYDPISAKISDMQMVETMRWGVESIGQIYAVPLFLLNYPGANGSYNSLEMAMLAWLQTGLNPVLRRIEDGLARLIPGDTTFISFNAGSLLKSTQKETYETLAIALNNGLINLDEARAIIDKAPLPDGKGQEFWKPLNIGVVGSEPKA
jgi:HK97 family phage portal protein